MDRKTMNEIIELNKKASFPTGMCCSGERCSDCRYIDMDNNMYNDKTRHCSKRGRWVNPSDKACSYFAW